MQVCKAVQMQETYCYGHGKVSMPVVSFPLLDDAPEQEEVKQGVHVAPIGCLRQPCSILQATLQSGRFYACMHQTCQNLPSVEALNPKYDHRL